MYIRLNIVGTLVVEKKKNKTIKNKTTKEHYILLK